MRNFIQIFLAASLLLCGNIYAQSGDYENLHWSIENGVLTITGTGEMPRHTSTAARPWTDYRKQITKIVIEEGVTSVGNNAFFDFNEVLEISLPNSLKKIGSHAFYHCCSSIKQWCDLVIPPNVEFVGHHAFMSCTSLRSVTMPITNCTYELTKERINPDGNTAAGENVSQEICTVFTGTSIQEFILTGNGAIPNYLHSRFQPWYEPNNGNVSCQKIVIGEGITSVGQHAFEDMHKLKKIVFPNSLTEIQGSAFFRCDAVESIVFPPNLKKIEDSAFARNNSLSSITFTSENPPSITNIKGLDASSFGANPSNISVSVPEEFATNYNKFGNGSFKEVTDVKPEEIEVEDPSIPDLPPPPADTDDDEPTGDIGDDIDPWRPSDPIAPPTPEQPQATVTSSETVDLLNLTIYPNPCAEVLYLKNLPHKADIRLANISGKLLLHKIASGDAQLDVHKLPNGVFILSVNGKRFRIVKQ